MINDRMVRTPSIRLARTSRTWLFFLTAVLVAVATSADRVGVSQDQSCRGPSGDSDQTRSHPTGGDGSDAHAHLRYEGFGAVTRGSESSPGRYDTFHVTTLADSGTGSLRDAVSRGRRHIVFDLAGTITLQRNLNIRYSYITIDGASAPDPGITIVQPGTIGTTIEARPSTGPVSDVVIHHLRMEGQAVEHQNRGDIWGIDGDDESVSRVVIDHITARAATDGVFDIYGDVTDITLQWNLITDTVTMLHLSTGSTRQARERVSIHHNVFAGNNERQIRIRHNNQLVDYVNNIIYGWGYFEGGAAGLDIAYDKGEINPSLNVVNNLFHYVSGLAGDEDDAIRFKRGADEGNVYFSGNLLPLAEADNRSTSQALPIPVAARVTTFTASELKEAVLPYVGTHYPTKAETALLESIGNALQR